MSQHLWSSLRRLLATGIDAQVLKTGMAAGTSWYLAQWLFRTPRPYFAPLAAILSLQVSVADSISKGMQRVAGVGAGIAVAIFAGHFFRLSALSVGIVVYIAVFLATRLHMGPQGIPQAAITALLVMTVGRSASGYAWVRVVDTAIGVMVAILVNALIWPPDATKAAESAIITLAHAVADVVVAIRQDLIDGLSAAEANRHLLRARHVDESLETVRDAIRRAEKSLKWNVLMVRRRRRLKTLRQVAIVLEHTLSQVRGIARSLFVTVERDTQDPYLALPKSIATQLADLLALMGTALQTYIRIIVGVHPDAAYQLEKTLKQASKLQRLLLEEIRVSAGDWLDLAAVLADIEKMTEDLLVSARLLVPLVFPSMGKP